VAFDDTNLETEFKKINCDDENYYSNECNKFLLKKEIIERNVLSKHPEENPYLYPNLNDKDFNVKIATKKEFNDTKYDGTIHNNIKEQADILAKADFELQPHQAFVKNFMSFQTPYSSLLLYHGLGSGKTCSAIGVCEEMRDYMKQMGITKRIIIVASENVQDNFKLQLFDERKLKIVDGIWNIKACTGNKLIKEINPMNMNIPKEKVISQIKNLINTYYVFLGYGQFANYIIKTMNYNEEIEREKTKRGQTQQRNPGEKNRIQTLKDIKITLNSRIIKRLRNEFDGRLIVIDEVHNIRKTDDNENKKVAINLELLVKAAQNLRFLLLSATPMYNSYKEIVWLLNLMNTNDRRSRIEVRDIFEKNGNLKKTGEETLIRKSTGYISFVRGENPYTFPFRVYPNNFAKENTFPAISYPSYQMNLKKIPHEDKKRILSLYLNKIGNCENCGKCQYCVYKYIIYNLRNKKFTITTKTGAVRDMPSFENMESFGYTLLQTPLESLIISYPVPGLKNLLDEIPSEKFLDELSESFSESAPREEAEDEAPGLVEESEDKEEEEISAPKTKVKKPLIIEESDNEDSDAEFLAQLNAKGGAKEGVMSIDPHQLTGKLGLERMMSFVDEKSPPKKGEFEYKKSTITEYGKIFSQKIIGKFSWKIKSILDKIVDPENGKVGEGVILVYSQYIDSGLIPVALALEELGFTRYGQDVKPLFKNRPTEVVDVRTMKPPTDKKNFIPARYSIITGDPRLSPNNDFEVKGSTGEDNKDGNKVKVILISKAGSEGIDLKFIRQVHILEPWYNMNRIEQIIGRAVRNFSHKDLPFEKRNVEIFMYGTILGDNKEEAADLYVYRVAEYKAIQIGNVSRILKETAVDCIINHDQTNFTQEIMSASLKEPITQILSNGVTLNDFKVGDAPFSPACDYMANCNYSCRPDKKIDEDSLNEDTYDEKFIMINSEKILQRIRMLMKESFFYKKDTLLKAIRTPKEYPYVQIYSALTQLIEDNNEFIVDKYGRNGRLINIGEYYLFQPIELRDNNVSIFDRSVPIDYKHSMINFEIKQDIVKPVIDKRNLNEGIIEGETELLPEGKRIIDEMNVNLIISKDFTKQTKVPRGDDNWYKHCGIVIKKMAKEYPETKGDMLIQFLIEHMIDLLLFEDKLEVMNYLYSLNAIKSGTFEWFAKEYFDRNIIVTKNLKAIVMYKLNKRIIMILNNDNKWVQSEPEDEREIAMSKEGKEILTFKADEYNKIVGFIGYEKSNRYLVFKTKDMLSKRDTGARCDEAGKDKTMKKINEIVGETKYTNENTKLQKDADGNVTREAINHVELCVFQEFILRYFDAIKRDDKKWFLTPEMAIFFKLYTVNV
jgi:superfamily II DNA or RNA helicase